MDTNYNKLLNNLTDLKLERMKDNLPQYIDMINSGNKTIVDALYELTEKEKSFKKEKAIKACVMTAGFPFHKTLDDYDFSFQPGINKKEIEDYMTLRFIDNSENIYPNITGTYDGLTKEINDAEENINANVDAAETAIISKIEEHNNYVVNTIQPKVESIETKVDNHTGLLTNIQSLINQILGRI